MDFGTASALIGLLLGAGASLDFALKAQMRQNVAAYISGLSGSSTRVNYGVSRIIDRVLGPQLLSLRAILFYVGMSSISLAATYYFAVATSEWSAVWIFEWSSWKTTFPIFIIFFAGCLLGDCLSYAQTRLFLRAIDDTQRGVISLGLALADAVISLAIFVAIFSVIRAVAYLIVISTSPTHILTKNVYIAIDPLEKTISSLVRQNVLLPSEVVWTATISSAKSNSDIVGINDIQNNYSNNLIGSDKVNIITTETSLECAPSEIFPIVAVSTAKTLTSEVAINRGWDLEGGRSATLSRKVLADLKKWKSSSSICPLRIVKFEQVLTPVGLIKTAGLSNTFAAAFEKTLFDFYTNFAFKLAPYTSINPYGEIGDYYQSIVAQTEYGVLGFLGDPGAKFALSGFSYDAADFVETLQIPFSPMLASCLTISLVFWVYIMAIYVSRIANFIQEKIMVVAQVAVDKFEISTAPFTFIAISISVMLLGFLFITWVAGAIWDVIF